MTCGSEILRPPVPEIAPLKVTAPYPPPKLIVLSAVTVIGLAMVAPLGPGHELVIAAVENNGHRQRKGRTPGRSREQTARVNGQRPGPCQRHALLVTVVISELQCALVHDDVPPPLMLSPFSLSTPAPDFVSVKPARLKAPLLSVDDPITTLLDVAMVVLPARVTFRSQPSDEPLLMMAPAAARAGAAQGDGHVERRQVQAVDVQVPPLSTFAPAVLPKAAVLPSCNVPAATVVRPL